MVEIKFRRKTIDDIANLTIFLSLKFSRPPTHPREIQNACNQMLPVVKNLKIRKIYLDPFTFKNSKNGVTTARRRMATAEEEEEKGLT